jgi:hypothetical protein
MAAQIVDELIVTLSLDAQPYAKAEAQVERQTDRTFRKQQERARVTDRVNKDQQRRLKDVAAGVRAFGVQVAAAVGVVTGLGVAVGGVLGGFLSFQTALRRQTVGTDLSNRQMQAWSATARRLGADAAAGAEAIAALSKERQQFELTGNAPTMQALARMGVNVDRGRPLEDVLAQAQQIYRNAPNGQRQQYENTLAAQGVSSDLILMIKSERDVREAFTQSLAQATEENRKALDQLADAFESIKATSITVAGTLLEALQPAIKESAVVLAEWATKLAGFTKDVQAAGGGVDGFRAALDKNTPQVSQALRTMGDVISVINNEIRKTARGFGQLGELLYWVLNRIRAPWGSEGLVDDAQSRIRQWTGTAPGQTVAQNLGQRLSDWWGRTAAESRAMDLAEGRTGFAGVGVRGRNPHNLPRNIENDSPSGRLDAQSLMSTLITQYGLTAAQAAAVVTNWVGESSLNPRAFNGAGGGTGARGLAQWRGGRTAAFQKRYGVMPDQASAAQQIEFAMTDPYERALMQRAFAVGGSASALSTSYSKLYEAHGNVREDMRRGVEAQRLEAAYRGNGAAGSSVNIQNMTVQSNNPAEFANGLQRLEGSQPYNTVIR